MNWDALVKSKDNKAKLLVDLHVSRWSEWENYINMLKDAGFSEISRSERDWGKMLLKLGETEGQGSTKYKFLEGLSRKRRKIKKRKKKGRKRSYRLKYVAWATRTLKRGNDYILLNASFGSLDIPSDLDVIVVSTTPEVFEIWMSFTRAFVEGSDATSFCEYWDSNFYYEPGVWQGDTVVSLTSLLISKNFVWTTKDTALYELSCVKAYCDAYEKSKNIVVDGRVSSPNPVNMTLDREQTCYETALFFAEAFRAAYAKGDEDAIRYAYLKYAVTKIEALVSVPSLAVSQVFGESGFKDFVDKKGSGKYLETYMTGISAYELLRNLRMHSKNGMYKSKYANRMRYVLTRSSGLCTACSREFAERIAKTNRANLRMIELAIVSLLDFMDGESKYENKDGTCPYLSKSKVWLENLGGKLKILCARAFDYVDGLIKEETSEKERGSKYVIQLIKR